MLLFHATTMENANQILKEGFKYKSQVWSCSDEQTYFFTESHIREQFGDELSRDEVISEGVRVAMDQARITLAVQNPKDYRGVVLVFDSSLMKNGAELEPDYSCENMDDVAVCVRNPDMAGLIAAYRMTESEASFRLFQLVSYVNSDYQVDLDVSNSELAMIKSLQSSNALSSYFDVVSEKEYELINLAEGDLKAA